MKISKKMREDACMVLSRCFHNWEDALSCGHEHFGVSADAIDLAIAANYAIPVEIDTNPASMEWEWYLEAEALLHDGWCPGDLVEVRR